MWLLVQLTNSSLSPLCATQYKPTKVQAGQSIDVTWAEMGHSGGYVRLALAPKWWMTFDVPENNNGEGNGNDTIIFASNVLKFDCYGGGTKNKHTCL